MADTVAQNTPSALELRKRRAWWLTIPIRLFKEKPLGAMGLSFLMVFLLVAVFADLIATQPHDLIDVYVRLEGPSTAHWLGTDHFGRDIFSRIVYGARVSMYVAVGAVTLSKVTAIITGTVSGYFGGKLDLIWQRVVDAVMAFPNLILLLAIVAVIGPGLWNLVLALAFGQVWGSSRIMRATAMSIRNNTYIDAARAIGCSHTRIIFRHMLPNMVAPIIVSTTLSFAGIILAESSLSFLGFGVPPPFPSWGRMLSDEARQYMLVHQWLAIWPGVAITLVVFGFNAFGDSLRDLLDPRLRGSGGRRRRRTT